MTQINSSSFWLKLILDEILPSRAIKLEKLQRKTSAVSFLTIRSDYLKKIMKNQNQMNLHCLLVSDDVIKSPYYKVLISPFEKID